MSTFNDSYNHSSSYIDVPLLTKQLTAFIPSAIMLTFGVTANIAIIVAIIKNNKSKCKDRLYCFIGNLAVYDVFLLLVCMSFKVVTHFTQWPFGSFLCHIYNGFQTFFFTGCAITMTLMALDHHHVLTKAASPHTKTSSKIAMLLSITLMASICCCPIIIYSQYRILPRQFASCFIQFYQDESNNKIMWQTYRNGSYAIFFLIPNIIIVVTYFQMSRILKRQFSMDLPPFYTAILAEQRQVIKMILYTNITFVLCWTPYHLYRIIVYFNDRLGNSIPLPRYILLICQLIAYSNSAIHPFIYAKYTPICRQALYRIFCLSGVKQSTLTDSNSESESAIANAVTSSC